jgi:hypothetical protein
MAPSSPIFFSAAGREPGRLTEHDSWLCNRSPEEDTLFMVEHCCTCHAFTPTMRGCQDIVCWG